MTRLHRTGLFIMLFGVILFLINLCIALILDFEDLHPQYFRNVLMMMLLPIVTGALIVGVSWKWPLAGGCIGVFSLVALPIYTEMAAIYRWLYTAAVAVFFTGGVLLLANSFKTKRLW